MVIILPLSVRLCPYFSVQLTQTHMEEIEEQIPVVENYILLRTGQTVLINKDQFKVPDPFLLGQRISYLNKAFVIAKEWLDNQK